MGEGSPVNYGFTGTRWGMRDPQAAEVERIIRTVKAGAVLHHGRCVGSDHAARTIALEVGHRLVAHPATGLDRWQAAALPGEFTLDPVHPLTRNRDIVDAARFLIAAPRGPEESDERSGTWYTIRHAKKVGRPTYIVLPDGTAIVWKP